ncbi:unnamed protein product, partial [marine sediment metagenome]
ILSTQCGYLRWLSNPALAYVPSHIWVQNVDEIAYLRKQGYTQKEVAQELGVHIKTVRKYDRTK